MTLCVAWKWETESESKVCFAADTCVTFGKDAMPFGGVKVLGIPVRYSAPVTQGTSVRESWTWTYGFAFSGNYLAAFLVKEMMTAVLADLQGIGGAEMAQFERICALVGKFHSHFFQELREATARRQDLDFFFGGFCPVAKKVRVARFIIDPQLGNSTHHEILKKSGESFETLGFGPACARFRELFELSLSGPPCRVHYAAFRRLRDVILSGKFKSVAGAIQYGEFGLDGNFRLFGSGMLEMGDLGPVMKTYVRGTNVDDVYQPKGPTDLYLGGSTLLPFAEDIHQFDSTASFWGRGNTHVMLDELITVLPHEPRWRPTFVAARRKLRKVFPRTALIEHIGSTAVPGLPAVPTIDIMIAVDRIEVAAVQIEELNRHGFQYLGPQRNSTCHVFRQRAPTSINLFVVARGDDFWRFGTSLRDFFRIDSAARDAYAREKIRILNRGGWTLLRYNQEKNPMLMASLQAALRHADQFKESPTSGSWLTERWDWIRSWFPTR